jgi:hypothetical protein
VEIPRVQVNTFPSNDEEFARFATELLAAVSDVSDGVVAWFESALRERYPKAAVAQRSDLASMSPLEPFTVYAYRDGSPLSASATLTMERPASPARSPATG